MRTAAVAGFRLALLALAVASITGLAGCAQEQSGGPPLLRFTALVEHEEVAPGAELRAALTVTLPKGYHVQSNKPRNPSLIQTTLKVDSPAGVTGVTVEEVVFPPSTDFRQEGLIEPLAVFEREFTVGVRMTVAATAASGAITVPAMLGYQACDDHSCYTPESAEIEWTTRIAANAVNTPNHPEVFAPIAFGRGVSPEVAAGPPRQRAASTESLATVLNRLDGFERRGVTNGFLRTGAFLDFIHNADKGIQEKGMFAERGPLAILVLVFLGGLALNLTPCVLPMIPINLAIIGAGAQTGSRKRGFLLGSAYGGAMAVVYGVLGLVVILTAGTFGTVNASPWFNVGIAVFFAFLALAMFDVFTIDFSRFSSGFQPGVEKRGSFLLAFTMGAVAALLAGACVAPVVIEVVLFSSDLYAKGTPVALALPFLLGAGMAVPWPFAGAGMASLPKPGPWMTRVKQAFGVLILGTAAYYGYVAYDLFSNRLGDPVAVQSAVEDQLKEGWTPSLAEGLATAQREGKPVLIDVWASWCNDCLAMNKTTLKAPAVNEALRTYVKIKFQVEDARDRSVKPVIERLGVRGFPTYIVLHPKSPSLRPLLQ